MRSVFVAVSLLLIVAPAQASQVKMRCTYSVPSDPGQLDDPSLGGRVVRGALKSDCRAAEDVSAEFATPEIRYYSPVHLLPSGVCKAAISIDDRLGSEFVARQLADHGCPPQRFERYVDTRGIDDATFVALARFWRDLPQAGLDEEALVRRAGADGADLRKTFRQVPLKRWLGERRALGRIEAGDEDAQRYLLPEEGGARTYVLEDTFALAVTVMAVKGGGFRVIAVADQVP